MKETYLISREKSQIQNVDNIVWCCCTHWLLKLRYLWTHWLTMSFLRQVLHSVVRTPCCPFLARLFCWKVNHFGRRVYKNCFPSKRWNRSSKRRILPFEQQRISTLWDKIEKLILDIWPGKNFSPSTAFFVESLLIFGWNVKQECRFVHLLLSYPAKVSAGR